VSPPARTAETGLVSLQVGAFKDRASADAVTAQLRRKGYAAHVISPEGARGGLFNVRVGPYKTRAEAERIRTRLEQQEKFKPFVVKP
jgi:cell division septation protein DedD